MALMKKINDLEAQVQAGAAAKNPDLPPPPLPRSERKFIRVYVRPDTMVRTEVPDDYNGPGLDGTPVRGYINHANTVHYR